MSDNPYASPSDEPAVVRDSIALSPPQSVKFELTEEDVLDLNDYLTRYNPTMKSIIRRGQIVMFVLAGVFLLLAALIQQSNGSKAFSGGMILGVILMTAFGFAHPARIRRSSKKHNLQFLKSGANKGVFTEKLITIDREGVTQQDDAGHAFRKWWTFEKIVQNDRQLFLFYTSTQAFLIPSRAFVDEVSFEAFATLAERLWDAGKREHELASS